MFRLAPGSPIRSGNRSIGGSAKSRAQATQGLGRGVKPPALHTMSDFRKGMEAENVKFLEEFEMMMNTGASVLIINLKTVDLQMANHSFIVVLTKDQANTLGEALIKGSRKI